MSHKFVNMPRLLAAMKSAGLDAAVVASPDNFFYVSSVKILTQVLVRDRLALAIVTSDGAASRCPNPPSRRSISFKSTRGGSGLTR